MPRPSRRALRILLLRTSPIGAAFRGPAPPCVIAPLGVLYLASSLRKRFGSRVDVIVESLSTAVRSLEDVPGFIARIEPDVVGISSSLVEEQEAVAVAEASRGLTRPPLVVVGGPYPTCSPERALRRTGADAVVLHEGEVSFADLVGALLEGGDAALVPGTMRLDGDGNPLPSPAAGFIENLDAMPHPAWDLIPIEAYSKLFNFNDMPALSHPYVPVMTSRGCTYRCSFCHNIFGKRFRVRSPENVLEEIELLHDRFGVREIHVVDDIFNADPERVERICRMIIRRGLSIGIAFPNGLRGDVLTKEQLRLLRKAGCYSITLALESASPRIQRLMRKRINLEKLAAAARTATELGIITSCFVMFGYPGETREDLETTIRWVRDSTIDFPRHCIASPFPGTGMSEHARERGFDPEGMEAGRASYDKTNAGLAAMSPEEFRTLVREGIREIMDEPKRRERLKTIWSRWGAESWPYFGHPPGR